MNHRSRHFYIKQLRTALEEYNTFKFVSTLGGFIHQFEMMDELCEYFQCPKESFDAIFQGRMAVNDDIIRDILKKLKLNLTIVGKK